MSISFSNSAGNVTQTDNGYLLVKLTVNSDTKVIAVNCGDAAVAQVKAYLREASGAQTTLTQIDTVGSCVQGVIDAGSIAYEDTLDTA
jgi:hypothetical protein